jgi:glycosyltransferase involved in cell wall biosynthesis
MRSGSKLMLIDITRMVHRSFKGMRPTGVDRVSNAYVEHYGHRSAALVRIGPRWLVLSPRESGRAFDALLNRGPASARRLAGSIARAVAWPSGRCGHRVLIHTGHSGLEHASYSCEIRKRRLLPVYFAHDLIPISHPEYCRAGEAQRHARRIKTMFDTGKALIVNSQATRAAFAHYASAHGLRLPECVVAPLAPAPLPPPSDVPAMAHKYFVILGTIEPRKNHALLLHVWRRLVQKHGAAAPKLVVIGRRGWECKPVMNLLDGSPILRGHVLREPHCDDRALSTWLQHAQALLFPSFVEGFGMPLVEALALGVPVIASDLPVFRESAGAIPEYLDPRDQGGWHSAIVDYSRTPGVRRARQIERMRGYCPPSWSEHFERVDVLMDRCQRQPEQGTAAHVWAYAPRH